MAQEDKELLLKDICARLPYGVKMNHIADSEHSPKTLIGVAKDMITLEGLGGYECVDVEDYKPYLFPLSSMTEEKIEELLDIVIPINNGNCIIEESNIGKYMEWCYKNHLDVNDLIPKGLANDATGKKIY